MARLNLTSNLTQGDPVFDHQIQATHRGQAHFANTGPFGATCGECALLGYYQQHFNKTGDVIKATHRGGCQKFYELTGKHGPIVPKHVPACKYFKPKEGKQ
jgi:hypothetical protein